MPLNISLFNNELDGLTYSIIFLLLMPVTTTFPVLFILIFIDYFVSSSSWLLPSPHSHPSLFFVVSCHHSV